MRGLRGNPLRLQNTATLLAHLIGSTSYIIFCYTYQDLGGPDRDLSDTSSCVTCESFDRFCPAQGAVTGSLATIRFVRLQTNVGVS